MLKLSRDGLILDRARPSDVSSCLCARTCAYTRGTCASSLWAALVHSSDCDRDFDDDEATAFACSVVESIISIT